MKIFYFTATGNSLSVAKQLQESQCEIINIATFNKKQIRDDSVGIVFPVFCYNIPLIVERFLKSVSIHCDYIWAVATCGSRVGFSFVTMDRLLKKQGKKLSYCKKIVLPDSCIAFKTPSQKKSIMLDAQNGIVENIKSEISQKIIIDKPYKDMNIRMRNVSWWFMKNIFGIKNKEVNDKCTKCNICVKICPVNNIIMRDNKPAFISECENCFACIQWCPEQAISFGKLKIDNTSKYNHPSIKASEMIKRNVQS